MKKVSLSLLMTAFFFGTINFAQTLPAENQPSLFKLYQAVQKGYVRAIGLNPKGYASIDLQIENLKPFPVDIDVAGSHLLPRGGRCQRLGLGPILTPASQRDQRRLESGDAIVSLQARETKTVNVATCCLDSGKASPSHETFDAATVALPSVRENVLRWWAEHPEAPQSDVNTAIWQNRNYVEISSKVFNVEGKKIALCSGTYYQLEEGVLLSSTLEGNEKFLGTNILQVIPTPSVVYAVTLEKRTNGTEIPVLWSLSMTGEESWLRVTDLDSEEAIQDILLDVNQNLVLVRSSGIQLWDRNKKQIIELFRSLNRPYSIHRKNANTLTIAINTEKREIVDCSEENRSRKHAVTELWELDFVKKSGKLLQRISGAETHAGKSGVFSISKTGHLSKFSQTSFKFVGKESSLREVIAVGPEIVWVLNRKNQIMALNPETGKVLFVPEFLSKPNENSFKIDAETGDLALKMDEKFYRVRASDGTIQELSSTSSS